MDKSWSDINEDILLLILAAQASPEAVRKLSLTCKRFDRVAVGSSDVWKRFQYLVEDLFAANVSEPDAKLSSLDIIDLFRRLNTLKRRISSWSPNVKCLFSKKDPYNPTNIDLGAPESPVDDDEIEVDEDNLYEFNIHQCCNCDSFVTQRTVKRYESGWSTEHDVSHVWSAMDVDKSPTKIGNVDKDEYVIQPRTLIAGRFLTQQSILNVGGQLEYKDVVTGEDRSVDIESILPGATVDFSFNRSDRPWIIIRPIFDDAARLEVAIFDLESCSLVLPPQEMENSTSFPVVEFWSDMIYIIGDYAITCYKVIATADGVWSVVYQSRIEPVGKVNRILDSGANFFVCAAQENQSVSVSVINHHTGANIATLSGLDRRQVSLSARHRFLIAYHRDYVRIYDLMASDNAHPLLDFPAVLGEWKQVSFLDAERWIAVREQELLFLDFSEPHFQGESPLSFLLIEKPELVDAAIDANCVRVDLPLSSSKGILDTASELLQIPLQDLRFDAFSFFNIRCAVLASAAFQLEAYQKLIQYCSTIVLSAAGSQNIDFSKMIPAVVNSLPSYCDSVLLRNICSIPSSFALILLMHVKDEGKLTWTQKPALGQPPSASLSFGDLPSGKQWSSLVLSLDGYLLNATYPGQAWPYLLSLFNANVHE
jgi:hypothetical protein